VRVAVAPTPAEIRLAQRLRQFRDHAGLTQADLASAFAAEHPITPKTVSSWENTRTPAAPPEFRLEPYARFFATPRSLEAGPRLIPQSDLTPDEIQKRDAIESELLDLWTAARGATPSDTAASPRYWFFDDTGPITIICPNAPEGVEGPLASPENPNYTHMHSYGDLDALIELHGHIRAQNSPDFGVFHKLASEVRADDLSGHVVLLGGIGWNNITARLFRYLDRLPVTQVEDEQLNTGEVFAVRAEDGTERRYYPTWADENNKELTEDIALLARLENPFNSNRTLTICNGVHSRGVLGAVRALTDARLRESNEAYLAEHFPEGEFALLLRVPVVEDVTLSPDIQHEHARLYEWPSGRR
jgi:transcriptional regulator with XRE-family HTH domain